MTTNQNRTGGYLIEKLHLVTPVTRTMRWREPASTLEQCPGQDLHMSHPGTIIADPTMEPLPLSLPRTKHTATMDPSGTTGHNAPGTRPRKTNDNMSQTGNIICPPHPSWGIGQNDPERRGWLCKDPQSATCQGSWKDWNKTPWVLSLGRTHGQQKIAKELTAWYARAAWQVKRTKTRQLFVEASLVCTWLAVINALSSQSRPTTMGNHPGLHICVGRNIHWTAQGAWR